MSEIKLRHKLTKMVNDEIEVRPVAKTQIPVDSGDTSTMTFERSRRNPDTSTNRKSTSQQNPLLSVYKFSTVFVDIRNVQIKNNLIRKTNIEDAKLQWTEKFHSMSYGAAGRHVSVAPIGKYSSNFPTITEERRPLSPDVPLILVDGAHRVVALKQQHVYERNKIIPVTLYTHKDSRELNEDDYILIGSMLNKMDEDGRHMSKVDNVFMCKRFLTAILETAEDQSSNITTALRNEVSGANLRAAIEERSFNGMKSRQLLRYTTIAAGIHKFPSLNQFVLDAISNNTYQLRVFAKTVIWDGCENSQEVIFALKRLGNFTKEYATSSERDLTKYSRIILGFLKRLSQTIECKEKDLNKGYLLPIKDSSMKKELTIAEYAENKLMEVQHSKILVEARQWTSVANKVLDNVVIYTMWENVVSKVDDQKSNGSRDSLSENEDEPAEDIRTEREFESDKTKTLRRKKGETIHKRNSKKRPWESENTSSKRTNSRPSSKSKTCRRSVTKASGQLFDSTNEIISEVEKSSSKTATICRPATDSDRIANLARVDQESQSNSRSEFKSSEQLSGSSRDDCIQEDNGTENEVNVYASASDSTKAGLQEVVEMKDLSNFGVTHRWSSGFTYSKPSIRKGGWSRLSNGDGEVIGWHSVLRTPFPLFDDRLCVDVLFNSSWKMEPMSSSYMTTARAITRIPNCFRLFSDLVEGETVVESALRAVGIRPPHRAHFTLEAEDLIDVRARLTIHSLKSCHQGIMNGKTSLNEALRSGHAEFIIQCWLKSKRELLETRGYVVFEGFTYDAGLLHGSGQMPIGWTDRKFREIETLFQFVTSDAPKDGETVEIVDPKPVPNNWTTICNRNDRKDDTESGDPLDVRYSTRSWATNGALEQNSTKLKILRGRCRLDFRIMQLGAFLGLELGESRGDEEEIEVISGERAYLKRGIYSPDTGGRFLGTGTKCRDQLPHLDYEPDEQGSKWKPMKEPGYFVLVTAKDSAPIWILPNSHEHVFLESKTKNAIGKLRKLEIFTIPPYSIFFCRGDVIHAGAGHIAHLSKRNWRYHLYLVRKDAPHADAIHPRESYSLNASNSMQN